MHHGVQGCQNLIYTIHLVKIKQDCMYGILAFLWVWGIQVRFSQYSITSNMGRFSPHPLGHMTTLQERGRLFKTSNSSVFIVS